MEGKITQEEVEIAFISLNKLSSDGPDGISVPGMLQFKKKHVMPIFVKMYNELCEQQQISTHVGVFLDILVNKLEQSTGDISKYRLITFNNNDFKILLKIIAMRLSRIIEDFLNIYKDIYREPFFLNLLTQIGETTDVRKSIKNSKVAVMAFEVTNALDSLNLEFLTAVMGKLSFSENS